MEIYKRLLEATQALVDRITKPPKPKPEEEKGKESDKELRP